MAPVVLAAGSSAGGIGSSLVPSFAAAGSFVYATARRIESMLLATFENSKWT
jgi:NADP-dependent 3-hydroxy acid dehydrogenase YdfG